MAVFHGVQRTAVLVAALAGLGLAWHGPQASQEGTPPKTDGLAATFALQDALAQLAERVFPSVVGVTAWERVLPEQESTAGWVEGSEPRYPGYRSVGSCSGTVIGERRMLTGSHILVKQDGSQVDLVSVETVDKRHTLCRILGTEPTLGLALIELAVYPELYPPQVATIEQADVESIQTGHLAFAFGDPAGPGKAMTLGTFNSKPERQCYQGDRTAALVQASLEVNPESFGGPLVTLTGGCAGLLVPRDPANPLGGPMDRGRGFALPLQVALEVAQGLELHGSHQSPWLGFSVLEITALRARLRQEDPTRLRALKAPLTGVYIDDRYAPSPASEAGIAPGDFLVSIDGRLLYSVLDFQEQLYLSGIGKAVTLGLQRNGENREVQLTVGPRPLEAKPR